MSKKTDYEKIAKLSIEQDDPGELRATLSQFIVRMPEQKRDELSVIISGMTSDIDKSLIAEKYKKIPGKGKKSEGRDFIINAFSDLIINAQDSVFMDEFKAYLKEKRKQRYYQK